MTDNQIKHSKKCKCIVCNPQPPCPQLLSVDYTASVFNHRAIRIKWDGERWMVKRWMVKWKVVHCVGDEETVCSLNGFTAWGSISDWNENILYWRKQHEQAPSTG